MTLQQRLTSAFQGIGQDIKSILTRVTNLENASNSGGISEFVDLGQNAAPVPFYIHKKTVDSKDVRYFIMGYPVLIQYNEYFLEYQSSDGIKKTTLK
jgi:hypothetical protein